MSNPDSKDKSSVTVVSIYPAKGTVHPEEGGVASYTHNLCTELARKGEQVSIVCNVEPGAQPDTYSELGVQVVRAFRKNLTFFWDIARTTRQLNSKTVHFQQELALYGGLVSAFLLPLGIMLSGRRARKVVTLHAVVARSQINADFIKENNSAAPVFAVRWAFRIIYTLLNWSADKLIVHEAPFRERLIRDYHVDPHKIAVIPHGIERADRMDQTDAREQLAIDPRAKVLLFVGYLTGYKGLDLLIEGYARYVRDHPKDRSLLIIGAGKHPKLKDDPSYLKDSYERLQKKAKDLLPDDKYRWSGFIKEEELQAYYSAADLSVYPYTVAMSSSGPMAMSIAYRTPFIASDVFSEYFPDADNLFAREEKSLADAIHRSFKSPSTGVEIEHMRSERAWPAVASAHLRVYTKGDHS